jgi:heme a synthase
MMKKMFQKIAFAALISVLALVLVGAIVRVTGAGMGCPDWPTCWGCLIPPTKVEDVNFKKLDLTKFQHKAERLGQDPSSVTEETLRRDFNPRHVWTEFINRLFSLPVGLFTMSLFFLSFWQRGKKPELFWLSFASLMIVMVNAWMGARVVYSGLAPGVLTLHMALAFLLIVILTFIVWRASNEPNQLKFHDESKRKNLKVGVVVLFFLIITEGIMGSQVRELTDAMSKHMLIPRVEWAARLEQSWIYLLHRSFSWLIFFGTIFAFYFVKKYSTSRLGFAEKSVLTIVLIQMILGVVMSQIHVFGVVQVLHVGLAAVLVSNCFLWMLKIWG